ncbi:MAG: stage II sporulation protein R [Peptococcaceae bacterium]|nr:stage II sporulation protein R [Peptococcaceae bacterium]
MSGKLVVYLKEEGRYWLQRLKAQPLLGIVIILLALLGITALGLGLYAGLGELKPAGIAPDAAGFIRWHFYANSDLPEDQLLKLEVKDQVMVQAREALSKARTARECREMLRELLPRLKEKGDAVLDERDSRQSLTVYYGPRYFSERQLDGETVPEGVYETVTFVLGDGKGTNWWCLLFPPLAPGKELRFYEPEQAAPTRRAEEIREETAAEGADERIELEDHESKDGGKTETDEKNADQEDAAGPIPVVWKLKILELFR